MTKLPLPFTLVALRLIYVILCLPGHNSFFGDVEMNVVSRVPNTPSPSKVRCQSKDDDIGAHILLTGQRLRWEFGKTFMQATLFFCHFYWGSKQKTFIVYDSKLSFHCRNPQYCWLTWEARPEGFYLSDNNERTWMKMNDWA
ncbi:hypothetical protein NMG60_11017594 [Bertholletia excelsa]